MKNAMMGILGVCLSLSATSALADSGWHTVLSCDNGAAIVDNISGSGRGGAGLGAQLVIRNSRIVQYFQQNEAAGEFVDGQWIGKSYFMPTQGGSSEILVNFRSQALTVQSDGQSLSVTSGGANWTFRNCVRK